MVRLLSMEGLKSSLSTRINNPVTQRRMVLFVVCVALLLDNMLYMVIVPIIPHYLETLSGKGQYIWTNGTHTKVIMDKNTQWNNSGGKLKFNWLTQKSDTKIGTLFAFKAIIQLMFNPLSGAIIDRLGYDLPMMFGLSVIFVSTSIFAFGHSYGVLFLARGLQGMGSAFADTSGLAMIADRFTVESERTKALGIALAFVSFGSLVAPPFGGILYQLCGKELPFLCLAFVALFDGILLMAIMQPVRIERAVLKAEGNLLKGTPIHRLLMDPYIAVCAGSLAIANVSLAFLEPTISNWMSKVMNASNAEEGLVWLPSFLPHVAGVITTIKLARKYPQHQWIMAAVGLAVDGASCFFIPFCRNFVSLMIPLCVLCYGIALIDTAILPTLAYLVDTRHVSVYGSVYAIADISYSLAYAIGPIVAGGLVQVIGFLGLNIVITLVTLAYVPVMFLLKGCYSPEARETFQRRGTLRLCEQPEDMEKNPHEILGDGTNTKTIYPGYEQTLDNTNTYQLKKPSQSTYSTNQNAESRSVFSELNTKDTVIYSEGYGYGQ